MLSSKFSRGRCWGCLSSYRKMCLPLFNKRDRTSVCMQGGYSKSCKYVTGSWNTGISRVNFTLACLAVCSVLFRSQFSLMLTKFIPVLLCEDCAKRKIKNQFGNQFKHWNRIVVLFCQSLTLPSKKFPLKRPYFWICFWKQVVSAISTTFELCGFLRASAFNPEILQILKMFLSF